MSTSPDYFSLRLQSVDLIGQLVASISPLNTFSYLASQLYRILRSYPLTIWEGSKQFRTFPRSYFPKWTSEITKKLLGLTHQTLDYLLEYCCFWTKPGLYCLILLSVTIRYLFWLNLGYWFITLSWLLLTYFLLLLESYLWSLLYN